MSGASETSLPKTIAKKVAPFVMAAATALMPDAKVVPHPTIDSPNLSHLAGQETREALQQLPANVIMIDFAPNELKEGIRQTIFPDEEAINSANIPGAIKDYIISRFGTHGENVATVIHRIWERLGFTADVNMYPLQNILDFQNVESGQDELGNQEYFLSIDAGKIAEVLQQYPNQKVVNLSLQLGKIGFSMIEHERRIVGSVNYPTDVILPDGRVQYYSPENELITQTREEYQEYKRRLEEDASETVTLSQPYPKLTEAYSKEDLQKNLPQLFALCRAFPDKLFVAAAGNEGENLEAIPDRPPNLLLVAEWNGVDKRPEQEVYGADVYIDNEELTIPHGSSFSSPVVSALGSILTVQGLTPKEIKQKS